MTINFAAATEYNVHEQEFWIEWMQLTGALRLITLAPPPRTNMSVFSVVNWEKDGMLPTMRNIANVANDTHVELTMGRGVESEAGEVVEDAHASPSPQPLQILPVKTTDSRSCPTRLQWCCQTAGAPTCLCLTCRLHTCRLNMYLSLQAHFIQFKESLKLIRNDFLRCPGVGMAAVLEGRRSMNGPPTTPGTLSPTYAGVGLSIDGITAKVLELRVVE